MDKILVHTSLLLFTGYTVWSVDPGSTLFSWHPTCMTVAQFFALEGVFLLHTTPQKWKLTLHWICQSLALTLLLAGFSVNVYNKELTKKPHFVNNHELAGLATVVLMTLQSIGGAIVKLPIRIKFVPPKVIRAGHRLNGIVTISASLATVFLMTSNKPLYSVAVILPALYIIFNALKSIFGLSAKNTSE